MHPIHTDLQPHCFHLATHLGNYLLSLHKRLPHVAVVVVLSSFTVFYCMDFFSFGITNNE